MIGRPRTDSTRRFRVRGHRGGKSLRSGYFLERTVIFGRHESIGVRVAIGEPGVGADRAVAERKCCTPDGIVLKEQVHYVRRL